MLRTTISGIAIAGVAFMLVVTMQEPGVSKLVSVKFKPAAEARPAARLEAVREEDLEPAMA